MGDKRVGWDQNTADSLQDAVVLVGMTYHEPSGTRVEQVFGTVVATDETKGVTLRLDGNRSGELYQLPPELAAFLPAKPGSYRLRQTGEVVNDPDFTAVWEVTSPSN